MAYRVYDDFSSSNQHVQEVFKDGWFNVTLAVGGKEVGTGVTAANCLTDVQLVYYMIFIIYRDGDKSIFQMTSDFTKTDYLPPNKKYHSEKMPEGMTAIVQHFQTDVKNRGKPVYVDGRCDPAQTKISSISKTVYTIIWLNFYYCQAIRLKHNRYDWQDYLLNDPLLPNEVKNELLMSSISSQSTTF